MASMIDAIAHSPEATAYQNIDGQRAYLGYGNGSIFIAFRDGYRIIEKVKDTSKIDPSNWRPLDASSR